MRRGERAPVYAVPGYVMSALDKSWLDYRDRSVFSFDPSAVESVKVKNSNGEFTLKRGPSGIIVAASMVMLDAARHDQKLPFPKTHHGVPELHVELAAQNHEELVFRIVPVPDEGSLELHDLDVLSVQLADDLRVPVRREERELLLEVDTQRLHRS